MPSVQDQDQSEDKIPEPPKDWDRCHFFVKHKRRFCKQHPIEFYASTNGGPKYCGNHAHLFQKEKEQERKRIPCPIDPSHYIYEDALAKHVQICPRAKRRRIQEQHSYYKESVNVGGHGKKLCHLNDEKGEINVDQAKRLAQRIIEAYQRIFPSDSTTSESFTSVTFDQMQSSIPLLDLSKSELEAGLPNDIAHHRIRSGGERHLVQHASLVGHLRRIGILPSLKEKGTGKNNEKMVILEMGAGRGILGLVAAGTAAASRSNGKVRLVLVERAGGRSKADTVLRVVKRDKDGAKTPSSYLHLDKLEWLRVQCDLAHVHMPTVFVELKDQNKSASDNNEAKPKLVGLKPENSEDDSGIVVVAKHLCGAGTDLALRSLQEVSKQVDACVMATCCHGLCNWNDYVGRDFLCRELSASGDNASSFSEKEFELMCRWTSGTVAVERSSQKNTTNDNTASDNTDTKADDEAVEHSVIEIDDAKSPCGINSIVAELKLACGVHGLGRACQRLIDQGRCEYLRGELFRKEESEEKGSSVELFHYVPPIITPQNAVLVAHKTK